MGLGGIGKIGKKLTGGIKKVAQIGVGAAAGYAMSGGNPLGAVSGGFNAAGQENPMEKVMNTAFTGFGLGAGGEQGQQNGNFAEKIQQLGVA